MAQVRYTSEIGGGLGTFNYMGDIAPNYRFANHRFGATLIYRSAISNVVSFRATLTLGTLAAVETPVDIYAQKRGASFSRRIYEVASGFEYHFLNWRDDIRRLRYSPYIHAGLGVFALSNTAPKPKEYSNVQLSIPFGVGIKYVLSPRYYLAMEFGVRKTLFDYIDNVSDGDLINKNYQSGNPYDFDTYFFTGLTINYTFYVIPCAYSPYKKNVF